MTSISSVLKHVTLKRSVVAVSAAAAIGLIVVAIHLRRKRQKDFPTKKGPKRKHRKSELSPASPSVGRLSKKLHSRSDSYAASIASSVASSGASSCRKRKPLFPGSREFGTVEKLYKEGVNSFENALEKWEEATELLSKPNGKVWQERSVLINKRDSVKLPSSVVDRQHDGAIPILSYSEHSGLQKKFHSRKRRPRYHSVSDLHFLDDNDDNRPCPRRSTNLINSTPHSNSMGDLRGMLDDLSLEKKQALPSLQEQLQYIVSKAKHLQETIDFVLYDENAEDSDTDITLIGLDESLSSDTDTESTSSYFSAREFWDTRSVDSYSRKLHLYEEALVAVEKDEVPCRTSRSSLLNCLSEEEFLAKLHCVRQGFEVMLQDMTVRNWLIESGRSMIECILCISGQNLEEFQESFEKMIDFVSCNENWKEIESELKGRKSEYFQSTSSKPRSRKNRGSFNVGVFSNNHSDSTQVLFSDLEKVVRMSFYDVVLDFLIMDAFDDLSNPPSPVTAIMQNKWLADSLKESALYTAVWSVLKAKRSRLQYTSGFVAHMYDISAHVTPVLAWGFLGPEGKLKDVCEYFKKEIMDFLRGLFSFDLIRYTTPAQMADDILKLSRKRFADLTNYLQNAIGDTGAKQLLQNTA